MLNKEISFDNFKDEVSPGVFRKIRYALWLLVSNIFFLTNIPYPSKFKVLILKSFGCRIGDKVVIKPWVKIKFPWMLTVGDSVWFGESVWIDNISNVIIGNNVCISQGSLLITGNHNYSSEKFELISKPIIIEDGVWVCAKTILIGGITIHSHAVLAINSLASKDLEPYSIYSGNPAIFIKKRNIR
jgi:putative colanic acid biosynthesis acetyltransferase WcaF